MAPRCIDAGRDRLWEFASLNGDVCRCDAVTLCCPARQENESETLVPMRASSVGTHHGTSNPDVVSIDEDSACPLMVSATLSCAVSHTTTAPGLARHPFQIRLRRGGGFDHPGETLSSDSIAAMNPVSTVCVYEEARFGYPCGFFPGSAPQCRRLPLLLEVRGSNVEHEEATGCLSWMLLFVQISTQIRSVSFELRADYRFERPEVKQPTQLHTCTNSGPLIPDNVFG